MIDAVIFDLDGVLVTTDNCHYEAWKKMADDEGIYFDRLINERLRGVSRMQSLEIVLERASRIYSEEEKTALAAKKNELYKKRIESLNAQNILPGAIRTLDNLSAKGVRTAVGSSSKNAIPILKKLNLFNRFDAIADGNQITKSKPDPEVFLLAAKLLRISPKDCLVVEDADSGVEAALRAGMKVLGVGSACENKNATYRAKSLAEVAVEELLG